MYSIVFGSIAICLGLWGMVSCWWYIVDLLIAVLPLFLLFGGFVALMAGIRHSGLKMKIKEDKGQEVEDAVND